MSNPQSESAKLLETLDETQLTPNPTKQLEAFCLENQLILVAQLAEWRIDFPSLKFEEALLRNVSAVKEAAWLDALVNITNVPMIVPPSESPQLPKVARSKHGMVLLKEYRAVIIQKAPLLIVAVYNPYNIGVVKTAMSLYFPGEQYAIVCITPHYFNRVASVALDINSAEDEPWDESLEEWSQALGKNIASYLNVEMLIEDIWLDGVNACPVVAPRHYSRAVVLKEKDALIVFKTKLNAWIITMRPFSEILYSRIAQALGLRIHVLAVGPNEFARLAKESEVPIAVFTEAEKEDALHVANWQVSSRNDVELTRSIVLSAIKMGASDIHIEPKQGKARVRFRVDNDLLEQAPLPLSDYRAVLYRLKIMGVMMQDVTSVLQDGAGPLEIDGVRYDLRFSTSILNGGSEAIVVRIFNSRIPKLCDLMLDENEMKILRWFLDQETGMVVCSGPTGSGKTTLLYGLLNAIDSPDIDIVTIEQPVEKFFENAKQISVHAEGKITYGSALRSILRQDPDVIMIGEIRDDESALKAVEAAMTGHLVLTTTHANSAVGVIERLTGSFPVDRVALASSLKLSIAQRLVGKLCPHCKTVRQPRSEDLEYFPLASVANPVIAERVGCSACRGTGVAGRHLIMEMLPIDDAVRDMIVKRVSPSEIETYNSRRGFCGLIKQASYLLQTGEIALEDARRFITKPLV